MCLTFPISPTDESVGDGELEQQHNMIEEITDIDEQEGPLDTEEQVEEVIGSCHLSQFKLWLQLTMLRRDDLWTTLLLRGANALNGKANHAQHNCLRNTSRHTATPA